MSVTRSEPARASVAGSPPTVDTLEPLFRRVSPETVGLGLLIVGGLVLRFVTVSHLWLDEALSANISGLPLSELADALRQDGHPPLYYVLLHGWMNVVGDGDVAVRSLSGVLSVAALPLMWLAGRRVGGIRLAWIATAFLAVSPYAVRYATETRMYALVMVLVLAGYLLLGTALERPTVPRLAGLAVLSGALLLSHYWALWLVAATVLVLGWRWWRADDDRQRRGALRCGLAVAAGGVLFLPWVPVLFDQLAHTGTPWAGPVRPTTLMAVTLGDLGGGGGAVFRDAEVLGSLLLVLFLLGLFARAVDARRLEIDLRTVPQVRAEAVVVGLTVAIGLGVSWLGSTAYASRYVSVVVPLFLLVVATGGTRLVGRVPQAVVVGGVCALALASAAYLTTVDRTQAGVIAEAIGADRGADDLVVMCPDQLGPAMSRLLPDDVEALTYPELGDPSRVDWRDYEERHAGIDADAVAEELVARAGDGTIWLVSSPSYRIVDTQCDALRDALGARRPSTTVVVEDGSTYYEHASLTRYPPS